MAASAARPGSAAAGPVSLYFICIGNSCRSQMAEGFARHYGGGRVDARSGGTRPAGIVAPKAIDVMTERGIDISHQESKALDAAFAAGAQSVVSMGCGVEDECPAVFLVRAEDWAIPDPVGKGVDAYRRARDEIDRRTRELLARHGIVVGAAP